MSFFNAIRNEELKNKIYCEILNLLVRNGYISNIHQKFSIRFGYLLVDGNNVSSLFKISIYDDRKEYYITVQDSKFSFANVNDSNFDEISRNTLAMNGINIQQENAYDYTMMGNINEFVHNNEEVISQPVDENLVKEKLREGRKKAFIYSLGGVAVWVVIGLFGYIASLAAFCIKILAQKAMESCGCQFDRNCAKIVLQVSLVMIFVAELLSWEVSYFINGYFSEYGLLLVIEPFFWPEFYFSLIVGYVFLYLVSKEEFRLVFKKNK